MLSDEEKEAVEYFKDDINYLEDALNHPNFLGHFITIRDKEFQMLKILVNLIEKQSKEIEELKDIVETLRKENVSLYIERKQKENKIKAKIEEINEKSFKNDINYSEFYYKKEVLQSLLEKE